MDRGHLFGIALLVGTGMLPVSAAGAGAGAPSPSPQRKRSSGAMESFRKFREEIMQDYSDFRTGILANYAEFLAGVWVEYERCLDTPPEEAPKPKTMPVAEADAPAPVPVELPKPSLPEKPPRMPVSEPKPAPLPVTAPLPGGGPRTVELPPVADEVGDIPESPAPAEGLVDDKAPTDGVAVDFYDMTLYLPDSEIAVADRLGSSEEFAEQWRRMAADAQIPALADAIWKIADGYGFNDYLTFLLTKAYVDRKYSGRHSTGRASLTHCLLAHMGSAARVGITEDGEGVILFPATQRIYGRLYLPIDGGRYYVFYDDLGFDYNKPVYVCQLPKGADVGRFGDMRLQGLSLPYKAKPYSFKVGDVAISGEVNANIFPLLFRYPHMDMENYAASTLLPEVRKDIEAQFRAQLKGSEEQQVNTLLRFTQKAFDYATDQDAWGFEKPYFLEESLFYPVNDCEDRSIFYSYFLWNVLGKENHVINYPGHEAVAVRMPDGFRGDSYSYDGATFFISDPTYEGANTGRAMSEYRTVTPVIDYVYK